jgi:signal transduction histidine kinase
MSAWSVNYLLLVNATLLVLLASFLVLRRRSEINWIFFVTNIALASWNVCAFLIDQLLLMNWLGAIARIQMLSAMIFANGLYYFSSSYPVPHPRRNNWVNIATFGATTLGILFTDVFANVEFSGGAVVYLDEPGYPYYSAYLSFIAISALYRLVKAWQSHPEHRWRIRYFFAGIFIFVSSAITFNLVLPSLGNFDFLIVGRLSATFAPLFFFYAITKHEFLDTTVIINKVAAWFTALTILCVAALALESLTHTHPTLNAITLCILVLVSALFGKPLQQVLLTTAKRKFVRGWYSTEEVINRLSSRITLEKNREAIFKEVVRVLDEVFELENVLTVVAVRDEFETFSYYKIVGKFQKIRSSDPLIGGIQDKKACLRLEEAPPSVLRRLEELHFGKEKRGVVLSFYSPEYLEGIIILGERSDQSAYSESDLRFFSNLINFLSPILYRLTPMEKLEQLYNESRQKLHEAEIQLLRAQKIESIMHATRQCHHEIRTPLNIIKLGIGRIKNLQDLEAYKQVAREEIDHALEIVDETLTITDVEKSAGNRAAEINVNDVIQRCMRLIDRTRYKVVLDLGALPPVRAVFSDIQVVITNLIHNAMEAMPAGGTLAFSTQANANDVVITVEDEGEGIPENLRSKVWEPYFSGRGSEVGNSTAGRGWGLTIVNRIISEHAGTIRFTSEEKVGTRFIVTLPRIKEEGQKVPRLTQVYP